MSSFFSYDHKMAIGRLLIVVASCVIAVTSTPAAVVNENGTIPASGLESCSASMDGQLPRPTPSDFQFSGNVRRYYVAAEEVEWDYAPTGWDNWLGVRAKDRKFPGSLVLTSPSRFLWKPPQEPTWLVRTPLARNG
jgi:hypothetical protein